MISHKDAKKKLAVIKKLIENGSGFDEWNDAGLLYQIKNVVYSDKVDYSSKDIEKMLEQAREF